MPEIPPLLGNPIFSPFPAMTAFPAFFI